MKRQSTSKGFAVLSAAGMIVKVLSLLYVPFLISIISREGYGIYGVTYMIFTFVYVLANSGIPVAISKMISELTAQNNYKDAVKAFKIARFGLLLLGIVMSILMLLFAYPLARAAKDTRAYLAVMALSPTILITSVVSSYRGYFQGRGNMTPTAVSQIGEQVINTIFSLVFAAIFIKSSLQAGVAGATVGTTLGALFACIYLMYMYEKNKKFRVPKGVDYESVKRLPNKVIFHRLINYGIPITMCVGLQYAGNLIDMFNIKARLLVAGLESGLATIKYGNLTLYTTLIGVPLTLISALSAAVLPAISGAAAVDNRKQVQEKVNFSLKLCFIVAIPAAVGLTVLSNPIFYLFSNSFDGAKLLRYGAVVIVLMSVVQIQTTILQSVGKLYAVTAAMVLGIIIKIICNFTLVAQPKINIIGAVVGNILCFTVPLLINMRYINKTLKIRINLIGRAIKPFIASIFMSVVVYSIYWCFDKLIIKGNISKLMVAIPTAISIFAGALVYGYVLILVGGIRKRDLDGISPRISGILPNFVKERMR